MSDYYENLKITELPNSEIEIAGQIPTSRAAQYRSEAIRVLNQTTVLAGFRTGHIPESVLVGSIGESAVLQKIAELALSESYARIIEAEKLEAIGRPEIQITKLAPGNPIGFKIKTAIIPKFPLPDYKSLAQEALKSRTEKLVEVSDEEVEKMIHKARPPDKNPAPLSDEEVKKFGNFKDLADFKARLKADMLREKGRREIEEKRGVIAEKLIAATNVAIPALLTNYELEKMVAEFRDSITKMGLKPEDYFEKIKKSEEAMRTEWRSDAEKRSRLKLILKAIAEAENIKPDSADIRKEAEHIMEHQKAMSRNSTARAAEGGFRDADPKRVQAYVEEILRNEKVFAFLEQQ